ncbi:hypothetical protein EKO27_g7954, partial [Xylaria grammica]
ESEASEWDGSTNPEMSTVSGSELLLNNRQSTPTSTPTKDKRRSHSTRGKAAGARGVLRRGAERDDLRHRQPGSEPGIPEQRQQRQQQHQQREDQEGRRHPQGLQHRRPHRRARERALRAEARRLAEKEKEKGRAAGSTASSSRHRRDFSYQRADLRNPGSAITEEQETGSLIDNNDNNNTATAAAHGQRYLPPPSSWVPESDIGDGSDLGTKSYKHYIPGISLSAGTESVVDSSVVGGSSVGGSDYVDEARRERRRLREARRSQRS